MDHQSAQKTQRQDPVGIIFFLTFFFLILLGIAVKRFLGHPEFMMLFHLPAAVFLVLWGHRRVSLLKKSFEKERRVRINN